MTARDDDRRRRAWARAERAAERRFLKSHTPPPGFVLCQQEQRRIERARTRGVRQVRRLVDRARRALDTDHWDDLYSDLVDAAAIMTDWEIVTPSRAGFTICDAQDLAALAEVAAPVVDDAGNVSAVVLDTRSGRRRKQRAA